MKYLPLGGGDTKYFVTIVLILKKWIEEQGKNIENAWRHIWISPKWILENLNCSLLKGILPDTEVITSTFPFPKS